MKNYLKAMLFFFAASVLLTSCSDDDDPKVDPNEYTIDGVLHEITAIPMWVPANPDHMVFNDYIKLDNPNGAHIDRIKITPITGSNPLEGTYTYSKSGDPGTYNFAMSYDYAPDEGMLAYAWTTSGDAGQTLAIELIEDNGGAGNIYDITISSFTLNYGNWDFATFTFVSEGHKELVFHYRGTITPA